MPIIDRNGRPRSIRTEDEREQILEGDLGRLPVGEQESVFEMYGKLGDGDPDDFAKAAKIEYETAPADIRTFLTDPYFLGETGSSLWPQLVDDMVELFEGQYHEVALTGSLGWGKSFFATTALAYVLYQMSCLREPQKAYGIDSGSHIYLAMLSVTEKVARRVAVNEFIGKVAHSRYFKEKFQPQAAPSLLEIRFPKQIQVVAGSTGSSAIIGLNAFAGFIDESTFMGNIQETDRSGRVVSVDKGEAIYKSITRRMKSRFQKVGHLPGVMIIASSKERPTAFVEQRIQQAREQEDSGFYVREYCLSGDTRIPLLDGGEPTIKELAERYGSPGETFWVYSVDANGMIVPGLAHSPRLTIERAEVVRVVLDNGESLVVTATHPFMLRGGNYRRAGDLVAGDSLMPLYRRPDRDGYEEIGQPLWNGRWQKTHHMAARYAFGSWPKRSEAGRPNVIHHVDHNKKNNRPDNMKIMDWEDHRAHHAASMDRLLEYVKTEKHRAFSSGNMSRLHADPAFAKRRNERGAARLKMIRNDPALWALRRERSARAIAEHYSTDAGRETQRKRNLARWDGRRKLNLDDVLEAAASGESATSLAARKSCTVSAVSQVLRRKGMPKYTELIRSKQNHVVVAVEPAGVADVYDLSVDGTHNFAVAAGVFVHNSTWEVKPAESFTGKFFKVGVGDEKLHSRILTGDVQEENRLRDLGMRIVDVPEEYRPDFERDLEGSLRDIAGVATISVSPYIQRAEQIYGAVDDSMPAPVGGHDSGDLTHEWMAGTPLTIHWGRISVPAETRLPGGYTEIKWRPIRNPSATRYAHVDPSLTGDSTGMAIGHISGWTEVVRRDPSGAEYNELAPIIETDLLLRVIPPPGDEILLSDVRAILYQFHDHGFSLGYVTLDQYQSADMIQQLRKRGIESEVVSVDRTTEAYDVLKTALYEGRVRMHGNEWCLRELSQLQRVPRKGGRGFKIDHPKVGADGKPGSKDVADALASLVFNLTQRTPGLPVAPQLGMSNREGMELPDHSWVTDGRPLIPVQETGPRRPGGGIVGGAAPPGTSGMPMPFIKG